MIMQNKKTYYRRKNDTMKIEWNYSKTNAKDCFLVRNKVFVSEQGFSEELEFDDIDSIAHHLCVYDNGKPIGAARLFGEDGIYHCGRICVLKEYRSKGVGYIIMDAMEKKAQELSVHTLELSSQLQASEFYTKCGFTAVGEQYMDEHCPHIKMFKKL